jgi:hypothetical protein
VHKKLVLVPAGVWLKRILELQNVQECGAKRFVALNAVGSVQLALYIAAPTIELKV